MTDRYEKIRHALARRPTPGPWELRDGRTDTVENAQGYPVCTVHWQPDERYGHGTRAAYIAACDPDTIRELLAERDALAAEVERLNQILGRIVDGDGDSILTIRAGADAFAAAREYLSAQLEDTKGARLPTWQDMLGDAEQFVRQKPAFSKYRGTVLENDVPVWIADFAQRMLLRQRDEEGELK